MKLKKGMRPLSVLLAVLLVSVAFVPAVSAQSADNAFSAICIEKTSISGDEREYAVYSDESKNRIRALSVLLAMLLMSMAIVPVSADSTTFLNEMGGKEVSAGEWLEVYDPDYFSTLTNDKKAQFNAMKITVPDLSQDVVKKSGTVEAEGNSGDLTLWGTDGSEWPNNGGFNTPPRPA